MAGELGTSIVIIETDSMLAQMALETNSFALEPTGGVIYEIKSLVNLFFSLVVVSFCPRERNRVAHTVTAFGYKCPHITFSWEGMPCGRRRPLVTSDITVSLV